MKIDTYHNNINLDDYSIIEEMYLPIRYISRYKRLVEKYGHDEFILRHKFGITEELHNELMNTKNPIPVMVLRLKKILNYISYDFETDPYGDDINFRKKYRKVNESFLRIGKSYVIDKITDYCRNARTTEKYRVIGDYGKFYICKSTEGYYIRVWKKDLENKSVKVYR